MGFHRIAQDGSLVYVEPGQRIIGDGSLISEPAAPIASGLYIPVKRDRTSKPPIGTPLRTDGHWSVQGLIGAWVLNEHSGYRLTNAASPNKQCYFEQHTWGGNGLVFNASGNFSIDINLTPPTEAYTVVCARKGVSGSSNKIVTWGTNGCGVYIASDGRPFFYNSWNSWRYFEAITQTAWHTIAFTVTGNGTNDLTNAACYFNGKTVGISQTSSLGSTVSRGTTTFFGAPGEVIQGESSFLLIYDRTLLPVEIEQVSANPWQIFEPEITWYEVSESTTPTINQFSYRFINDDGSESTATFAAALNTNIILSPSDIKRLRILLDATGDPSNKSFQLEYRHKPSGGSFSDWKKVS